MSTSTERALAYLDTLEADRRTALALSEQKAEEARLIKARQEGFRAAMEMLGTAIPAGAAASGAAASGAAASGVAASGVAASGVAASGVAASGATASGVAASGAAASGVAASGAAASGVAASDPKEPGRRRARRQIRELILRELSFSGQAMTATQMAKAIDYLPERTETALQRMEESGQVLRNAEGRWAIGNTAMAQLNGHATTGANGKSRSIPEVVGGSI